MKHPAKYLRISVVVFALYFSAAYAQQNIQLKSYTIKEGLAAVRMGLADAQGYTWFTSRAADENYFFRFDGKDFKKFEITGGRSFLFFFVGPIRTNTAICRDSRGRVWIGGDSGLVCLWNGEVYKHYIKRNGAPFKTIMSVVKYRNEGIVAMTDKGIYLINPENIKRPLICIVDSTFINFNLQRRGDFDSFVHSGKFKALFNLDSAGGIWWQVSLAGDSVIDLHRTEFSNNKVIETNRIRLTGNFHSPFTYKNSIYLRNRETEGFICCSSSGQVKEINSIFSSFVGIDSSGRIYFCKNDNTLVCDSPLNPCEFGIEKTEQYREYRGLPGPGYQGFPVGNEMWFSNSYNSGKLPNYVLTGNELKLFSELYPFPELENCSFLNTGDETIWAIKWQRLLATRIKLNQSQRIIRFDDQCNGNWYLMRDTTGTKYFVSSNLIGTSTGENICLVGEKYKKTLSGTYETVSWVYDSEGSVWQLFVDLVDKDKNVLFRISSKLGLDSLAGEIKDYYPDHKGGCYYINGKDSIYHAAGIKRIPQPVPSPPGEKPTQLWCSPEKNLHVETENFIFLFKDNSYKKIFQKKNLPDRKKTRVLYGHKKIYLNDNGKLYFIINDAIFRPDTFKYPGFNSVSYYYEDNAGRGMIFPSGENGYSKSLIVMEGKSVRQYPLPDSVNTTFIHNFNVIGSSREIMFGNYTRIFRLDTAKNCFYILDNVGQHMGFIWGGISEGNSLIVGGWGSPLLEYDLSNIKLTYPKLSFQKIEIGGKGLYLNNNSRIQCSYGEKVQINFIAIESFNQHPVRYQWRMTGMQDHWSAESKNESAEFFSLAPGTYTFQVRAKGESGVWTEPLTISISVLPPWYRTVWAYTGYVLIAALLFFLGIRLNGRRLRNANIRLQQKIQDATREIISQKDVIETKNKEIVDSIRYAQTIQQALLSSERSLKRNFSESFILYKPKDIVSGDFYWIQEKDKNLHLCTGDCTGHGVPGAFMSLLNISFLNEAVMQNALTDPGKILDFVREKIIVSLNPEEKEIKTRDGMDCVLCSFNTEKNELKFACANNPLWMIRSSAVSGTIEEFRPDKLPVGFHDFQQKNFTSHSLTVQKGDIFYLFTDGYADQFGGPKGKKYLYKRLKELLYQNHRKPFSEQKRIINSEFEFWKGDLEQVDDVCLIAIRV